MSALLPNRLHHTAYVAKDLEATIVLAKNKKAFSNGMLFYFLAK